MIVYIDEAMTTAAAKYDALLATLKTAKLSLIKVQAERQAAVLAALGPDTSKTDEEIDARYDAEDEVEAPYLTREFALMDEIRDAENAVLVAYKGHLEAHCAAEGKADEWAEVNGNWDRMLKSVKYRTKTLQLAARLAV